VEAKEEPEEPKEVVKVVEEDVHIHIQKKDVEVSKKNHVKNDH